MKKHSNRRCFRGELQRASQCASYGCKAAAVLGEKHRAILDYTSAQQSFREACLAATGEQTDADGEIEVDPKTETLFLNAKKSRLF